MGNRVARRVDLDWLVVKPAPTPLASHAQLISRKHDLLRLCARIGYTPH